MVLDFLMFYARFSSIFVVYFVNKFLERTLTYFPVRIILKLRKGVKRSIFLFSVRDEEDY